MEWIKNLDLAEKVTTSKKYVWKGLKTWEKKGGYVKNNNKTYSMWLRSTME